MERTTRSFIALPLPEAATQSIEKLQRQLRRAMPSLRTPPPESVHLTLRFLGNLTQESLDSVSKSVLSVGLCTAPIALKICGFGAFPSPRRPRVVWLGLAPCPRLGKLALALDEALESCGIPGEQRPFRAHLTIGRVRNPSRKPEPLPELEAEPSGPGWVAAEMILFESRLGPAGARHIPLTRAPFAAPAEGSEQLKPFNRETDDDHGG